MVPVKTNLRRRDVLWLALAVSVHALLLLVPIQRPPASTDTSGTISLSLLATREEAPVPERSDLPAPPPEKPRPVEEPAARQAQPAAETRPPAGPVRRESSPEGPTIGMTAARLVDSISRLKWPPAAKEKHSRLGVFVPQAVPENWRPRITIEENLFDGMYPPAKPDIVDRWLAADGSYRVVINTPSGNTLCGRARPWNPMNPLLEPVMMYWKCGGGGKRSFRMPDRHLIK